MRRANLEHLIRAAAAISDQYEIVIVGSQSILGSFPDAPDELLYSQEADVYPLADPRASDLIDGAIGEDSPFHAHFGYYAQGVDETTSVLPIGWQDRLIRIQNRNTDLKVGLCLEPHDLAAAKLYAGRDKDRNFVSALIAHAMVEPTILRERIQDLQGDPTRVSAALALFERIQRAPSSDARPAP